MPFGFAIVSKRGASRPRLPADWRLIGTSLHRRPGRSGAATAGHEVKLPRCPISTALMLTLHLLG
jgi:hypothetical protein